MVYNKIASEQNKKIFLGGLSFSTTDEILRTFCLNYGKITDCVVMKTFEGKPRGFGFVTYEDTSSVEDFMRARPHTIDNRPIEAKRATPREDRSSSGTQSTVKKLFISGLRDDINETNLREYFSRFGNITEVVIMKDRDDKPRGFGFISFDDYDPVDKIILEKPHVINGKTLEVQKALPKDKTTNSRNESNNRSRYNMSSNFNNFQPSFNTFGQHQPLMPPPYRPNDFNDFGSYNNEPSSITPFGNPMQNYQMSQQQSRRGGPIRTGRGRGSGPSGNNNRSAPYPPRGGRGGSSFSYRGRGRGQ